MIETDAIVRNRSPSNQLLWQYFYLQVLDFLTTIAFLVNGVREGNPLVRLALSVGTNPIASLLVVKLPGDPARDSTAGAWASANCFRASICFSRFSSPGI